MSGDESSRVVRRTRVIPRPRVPLGPLRELKDLLYRLYLEAGPPTLDEITRWINEDDDLPGAPERDTVRRCLGSVDLPSNQHDVTSIATVLARRAGWETQEVAAKVREHWIAARMTVHLGQGVRDLKDPIALQVHRAIEDPDAPPGLPSYLKRSHDDELTESLGALGANTAFIVLVGGSSTGKTRAAFEAVHEYLPDWRLHHPVAPSKPEGLMRAVDSPGLAPRTILWLDELSEYLTPPGGETAAAALNEALYSNRYLLAIGTIWPEDWDRLTTDPTPGVPAPHPQARSLLKGPARRIDISMDFDPPELKALAANDSRIQQALEATRSTDKNTQYLAAGFALLERRNSLRISNPGAWSVLTASMDAHRLGVPGPFPSDFLRTAAPRYLRAEEWGALPDNWFDTSVDVLTRMVRGAARPLARIRPFPDEEPRPTTFLLADYLAENGRVERKFSYPPASFWHAARDLDDAVSQTALGVSAYRHGRRRHAAILLQHAARKGEPGAINEWANWLWEAGDEERAEDLFRRAISLGYRAALNTWAHALQHSGDMEGAGEKYERASSAGQDRSLRDWAEALSKHGDWKKSDELFQRAHDAGDPWALWWWASSLTKRGHKERAADLAELSATSPGQAPSIWWVSALWGAGRRRRAEELLKDAVDKGNTEALWRWAEALWGSSEHNRAVELSRSASMRVMKTPCVAGRRGAGTPEIESRRMRCSSDPLTQVTQLHCGGGEPASRKLESWRQRRKCMRKEPMPEIGVTSPGNGPNP